MWAYRINRITPENGNFNVHFSVLDKGVEVKTQSLIVSAESLRNQPSDGRAEYIQQIVAEASKKFMVIEDVKLDFSSIVGNEYTLDGVVYETKAARVARLAAEQAAREALMTETGTI
jgi:hypothetical protein